MLVASLLLALPGVLGAQITSRDSALARARAAGADTAPPPPVFTRADTLRGSIGPGRAWWDVAHYDLRVRLDPADSTVRGTNAITYRVLRPARTLQLDLQAPLVLDSVVQDGRALRVRQDGNAWFVSLAGEQRAGSVRALVAHFHGRPRVALNAPWDGGVVWARDSLGTPWIATAVQGLGASAWWPNKDTQADEPDSMRVAMTVPDTLVGVSNGRLRRTTRNGDGTTTYEWAVTSPINNYGVTVNAGRYAHLQDSYQGERGTLTLDYWPLEYHADTARVQFQQVKPMLACFERWFGPYPWYADGYKLVETPHLGMEHQSAVAYGNGYRNGYRGRDLSGTGLGLTFDFIIVHESGHEWFGNLVTTRDIADMWVHEGFTTYSEALFVECREGKAAGARYVMGHRARVRNDRPIVGTYGVNAEGSGDMYPKAANMLHTIRHLVGDDARWRALLRGITATFGGRPTTGAQVERYMSRRTGLALGPVFDQYLRSTQLPVLEYRMRDGVLRYRWAGVVPGFAMPVRVALAPGAFTTIRPVAGAWRTARVRLPAGTPLPVDENWYVVTRDLDAPPPTAAPAAPGARVPAPAPGG